MSEWQTVKLGDLFQIKHGYAFKGEYFAEQGPYIVLTPGNFFDEGGFKYKEQEKFYGGKFPQEYILNEGDVIIAMTEQKRGLLGSTAIVPKSGYYLHNQRLGLINNLDERRVSKLYLYYLFNTWIVRDQIQATANGTKVRHTSPNRIYQLDVPLPPLETQHRIAAILSAYDDLIENNTQRIKLLEQAAHDLYREWFVEFRFPGYESVSLVDSGTDYGMIPQGWEVVPLSEIIDTQYGYTESAQPAPIGPKYLRGMDINKNSYIDWHSVPYCPIGGDKYEKFKVERDDVFMIRMADPGKVGIMERDDINAVFASYLVRWSIKDTRLHPYYLFYYLTSDEYQGYITGASTGTTRKSASAQVMTDKDLLIPERNVAELFETQIRELRDLLNNLLKKNNALGEARDLLLPHLVSGQVDVSDVEVEVAVNEPE